MKTVLRVGIFAVAGILALLIGYGMSYRLVKQATSSSLRVPSEGRDEAISDQRLLRRPATSGGTPRNDGASIQGSVVAAFGEAPNFTLTEASGRPFSRAELLGKPWIADFIFTSCSGQCPLMSAEMKRLQDLFRKESGMQFVSFTVDPQRDTPEVLSEYAARYGVESGRWFFLTGPNEEMDRILNEFYLSPVDQPAMHSIRFILVDRNAKIRGYYDSSEPKSVEQLIRDANLILEESHPEAVEDSRRISEILRPPSGASE